MGIDGPRSSHPSPVALGALVLLLCALVAATFDGARWTAPDEGEQRPPTSEQAESADRADEATQQEPGQREDGDEHQLPWSPPVDLLLLVPAALVAGVALVVMARLRVSRRRRRLTGRMGVRRTPVPDGEPPPDDDDLDLPEALGASARVLAEGSPRNAIVAAWVRLEQAVESERFPHRPEETPTELVQRVVSSYGLDGADGRHAIARLAHLYREARFSTHPVTEQHRAEAADCLRRLLTALRAARR